MTAGARLVDKEGWYRMQRPIGVTLLAVGAGLVGLYEIWRALIFMGVVSFNFVGKTVSFALTNLALNLRAPGFR